MFVYDRLFDDVSCFSIIYLLCFPQIRRYYVRRLRFRPGIWCPPCILESTQARSEITSLLSICVFDEYQISGTRQRVFLPSAKWIHMAKLTFVEYNTRQKEARTVKSWKYTRETKIYDKGSLCRVSTFDTRQRELPCGCLLTRLTGGLTPSAFAKCQALKLSKENLCDATEGKTGKYKNCVALKCLTVKLKTSYISERREYFLDGTRQRPSLTVIFKCQSAKTLFSPSVKSRD
jgi:hypothetical protein